MTLNYEQIEAEMEAGLHESIGLEVSRTTLAHLVMASQVVLRAPLTPGSAKIFRAFVTDARRICDFPAETRKLIQAQAEYLP